jgi:hypothetical protein
MSSPPVPLSTGDDESVGSLLSREDKCSASAMLGVASATSGAFQQWFENYQNVLPEQKIICACDMRWAVPVWFFAQVVVFKTGMCFLQLVDREDKRPKLVIIP